MSEPNSSGQRQIAAREIPRLQWDFRLAGKPRLVVATDSELMQIPDEIRKCVAFIGAKVPEEGGTASRVVMAGTVFFVDYPLGDSAAVTYAVTARHCIRDIQKHQIDDQVHFRLNTREHGTQPVEIPVAKWVYPDDERLDVAVTEFPIDRKRFTTRTVCALAGPGAAGFGMRGEPSVGK